MKFETYFKNTNFGTNDYDALILEGLEKICLGYCNGATIDGILLKIGLTEKRAYRNRALTDAGLIEMYNLKMTKEQVESE